MQMNQEPLKEDVDKVMSETDVDVDPIHANSDEMVAYFKTLGFDHVCYRAKLAEGRLVETWADNDGIFVEIDPSNRTFKLSVIDGMIESSIHGLGFPNRHTPVFLEKLRRHLPSNKE
jgi:hypothetical protein